MKSRLIIISVCSFQCTRFMIALSVCQNSLLQISFPENPFFVVSGYREKALCKAHKRIPQTSAVCKDIVYLGELLGGNIHIVERFHVLDHLLRL